ncbi:MAG: hypothetical protein AAB422_00445 [Planctomycetota bacterium]
MHYEDKVLASCKRRAKLYKIPEPTILKVLQGKELNQGNQVIIENVEGFKYPLKIVVTVENDIISVVTNYPQKKGKNDESILR